MAAVEQKKVKPIEKRHNVWLQVAFLVGMGIGTGLAIDYVLTQQPKDDLPVSSQTLVPSKGSQSKSKDRIELWVIGFSIGAVLILFLLDKAIRLKARKALTQQAFELVLQKLKTARDEAAARNGGETPVLFYNFLDWKKFEEWLNNEKNLYVHIKSHWDILEGEIDNLLHEYEDYVHYHTGVGLTGPLFFIKRRMFRLAEQYLAARAEGRTEDMHYLRLDLEQKAKEYYVRINLDGFFERIKTELIRQIAETKRRMGIEEVEYE